MTTPNQIAQKYLERWKTLEPKHFDTETQWLLFTIHNFQILGAKTVINHWRAQLITGTGVDSLEGDDKEWVRTRMTSWATVTENKAKRAQPNSQWEAACAWLNTSGQFKNKEDLVAVMQKRIDLIEDPKTSLWGKLKKWRS